MNEEEKNEMFEHIDKLITSLNEVYAKRKDNPVIGSKISESYIAIVKEDITSRDIEQYKAEPKGKIIKNSEEINSIKDNYVNNHMAALFLSKSNLQNNKELRDKLLLEFAE